MGKNRITKEEINVTGGQERRIYLDIIRIVATFLVIFTHTGDIGSKLYIYGNFGAFRKAIYLLADILRCVNIPFFFMISGALLLGKEENYKTLFFKRIFKYGLVLIIMSYFYFVVYYHNAWSDFATFLRQLCSEYVTGLYWFLYSYLGYLLVLPFLRKMVKQMTDADFKYFTILGIIFKSISVIIMGLLGWNTFLIPFYFATDALFYPVIGYFLSKIEIESIDGRKIYIGGVISILCIVCTGVLMHWEACSIGEYRETYLFSLLVIPAIYEFCLIRKLCSRIKLGYNVRRVVVYLSDNCFGVYLFSVFAQIKMINLYYSLDSLTVHKCPLLCSFIYVAIVMLVEALGVSIIRKIPVIRRYL